MADQLISTTNTAAIVPEVWSARFYEVLLVDLVYMDIVDKNYEGEIQALGDTVNISTMPEFGDASDLAEDEAADADSITISGQQLLINKRTFKDAIVTKRSQLQSLSFMDALRDKMIFAIMKQMQADIIAASIASASAPDHQIAYDSGSTLALADLLEGSELLSTAEVPQADRKCVVGSAQFHDLFNVTGFTSKDFIPAGSPLSSGMFNTQLAGFDVMHTNAVGAVTQLFHPSYITCAVQDSLNINVYDLGSQGKRADRVNADVLWGLKQLDDERIVQIS